jgi:hypothetical protein
MNLTCNITNPNPNPTFDFSTKSNHNTNTNPNTESNLKHNPNHIDEMVIINSNEPSDATTFLIGIPPEGHSEYLN